MAEQPNFLQLARKRMGVPDAVDDNTIWQGLNDPEVFQSAFPKHKLTPDQVTQVLAQSRPGPVSSQQLEQMKRNIGLSAISEAGHRALDRNGPLPLSGMAGLIDPISQAISGAFTASTQIPLPDFSGLRQIISPQRNYQGALGTPPDTREQPIRPFDPTALREDLGAFAQNTSPITPPGLSPGLDVADAVAKRIFGPEASAHAYTDPGLVAGGLAEGAIPFGNPLQLALMGAGGALGSAAARNAAIPVAERGFGNLPQYLQTAERAAQTGIGSVFAGEGLGQVLDSDRSWQERIQGLAPLGLGAMGLRNALKEGLASGAQRALNIDPATLAGPLRDLNHWEDLLRVRGFGEKQVGGISSVIRALADGQSAITGETVSPDQYLTSRVSKLDIGNHEDPSIKGLTTFQDDGRAVISAFQKADVSTMVHELAHVFRGDLSGDMLGRLEGELGVPDGQWGENHEEAFARGFERYLRDGVAPSEGLRGVFDQFKNWLTSIYKNVSQSSLRNAVGPELRTSLDYLLTGKGPESGIPLDELSAPKTLKDHVATGGGEFIGTQEGFETIPGAHLFNDPLTKSTLAIPDNTPVDQVADAVRKRIDESRSKFEGPLSQKEELYPELDKDASFFANRASKRLPSGSAFTEADLKQSALSAALQAAPRYDETKGASLRTFLSHRMKGAVIDVLRQTDLYGSRQVRSGREAIEGLDKTLASPGLNPEQTAIRGDLSTKLTRAIGTLSDTEQRVLNNFKDDVPINKIADALGVSPGRVSQIKTEALGKLRAQLQGNDRVPEQRPEASKALAQHAEEDLNDLGFFSKLARQVSSTTKETLSADRWLSAIDNPKSGITKDEIRYSGVKDWLKTQGTSPVSKGQLRDYVVANTVRLEESKARTYSPDFFEEMHNGVPNFNFEVKNPHSYRDILLKVPEVNLSGEGDQLARYKSLIAKSKDPDLDMRTRQRYANVAEKLQEKLKAEQYSDPHFNTHKNVIANLRVLDTPLDGGKLRTSSDDSDVPHWMKVGYGNERDYSTSAKALEIMEAQSQWEKEGRLQGWRDPEWENKRAAAQQAVEEAWAVRVKAEDDFHGYVNKDLNAKPGLVDFLRGRDDQNPLTKASLAKAITGRGGFTLPPEFRDAFSSDTRSAAENFSDKLYAENTRKIELERFGYKETGVPGPDIPLLQSWKRLVAKRMLRLAAEGGYDQLWLHTGDLVGERYRVKGKVEDTPAIREMQSRLEEMQISPIAGRSMSEYMDSIAREQQLRHQITAARAALTPKPTWTESLYDQMLPAELERAGRPFGLEVSKGERISDPLSTEEFLAKNNVTVREASPGVWHHWDGEDQSNTSFSSREDAIRAARSYVEPYSAQPGDPQVGEDVPSNFRHVIRLTPEQRSAILKEGFPLYQRVGEGETAPEASIKDKVKGALRTFAGATPNDLVEAETKQIMRRTMGEREQNYQQWKHEFADAREVFLKAPQDLKRAFIMDMQDPKRYKANDPFNPLREWIVQQSPEAWASTGRTESINPEKAYWSQQLEKFAPVRETLKEMFREEAIRATAMSPELLEVWKENYFPNIWENPGLGKRIMAQIQGKRPLKGSEGWQRLQKYTLEEGLAHGLKPITDNPIDLAMLHHAEINRFVFGMSVIQQMKDAGLIRFFKASEFKNRPVDWMKVDDHAFVVKSFAPEAGGVVERGQYLAPAPAAKVLNNYLSPRLYHNMDGWMGYGFDKFRDLGNTLNMLNLGMSGYHATFTTVDVMSSVMAQGMERLLRRDVMGAAKEFAQVLPAPLIIGIRGFKATREYLRPGAGGEAYAATMKQFVKAGNRIDNNPLYATSWLDKQFDATRAKMGKFDMPIKVLQFATSVVMKKLVPTYKIGLFHHMMEYQLERLGSEASPKDIQEAGQRVTDTIEDRLGQLNYDNLFWKNAYKDLAMVSVRSVGWNYGILRQFGGGAKDWAKLLAGGLSGTDVELTNRMMYPAALLMTTALLGGIKHYVMTGEKPKDLKDYYYPSDGQGGRDQLPSYVKDLATVKRAVGNDLIERGAGVSGLWGIAASKANPALTLAAAMMMNKDFYNTEIANADHPFVAGYAKYIAEAMAPFAMKNAYAKNEPPAEDYRELLSNTKDMLTDPSKLKKAATTVVTGITPAPAWVDRSPALDLAMRYQQSTSPKEQTEEIGLRSKVISWYTQQLRSNDPKAMDNILKALDSGKLSQKQVEKLLERADEDPLTRSFTYLRDMPQILHVWKAMTPDEKTTNVGALQKHIESAYDNLRPAELKRIEPAMLKALQEVP